LEPELEQAKSDTKGLAQDLDDVVLYAIFPVTGKRFLKWKYGKEDPPPEVRPRTLEQIKEEEELVKLAKLGRLVKKIEKKGPPKTDSLRTFNVFVDDEYFEVGVEEPGGSPIISYVQQMPAGVPVSAPAPVSPAAAPPPPKPALIIRYSKQVGDAVSKGDTVVILEAMKMENALQAPADGTIKAINYSSGDSVAKDDVLCVIG